MIIQIGGGKPQGQTDSQSLDWRWEALETASSNKLYDNLL